VPETFVCADATDARPQSIAVSKRVDIHPSALCVSHECAKGVTLPLFAL
jgi:hypothetical protein